MSTNNHPNWGEPSLGKRIDEAIELIQMELRHAVTYVNDAVIPQVRRESIQGLRVAAETLRSLADRFERQGNVAAAPGANQAEGASNQASGEPRS